MSRVRKTNSRPELIVRRVATNLGLRYRLYRRDLPGCPDLVFSRQRKIVFVHGCFWHQHDCQLGKLPSSRQEYWLPKLARNQARDITVQEALCAAGWKLLIIWECETRNEALV